MKQNGAQIGVLLINIGTPQSTQRRDIKRYLSEFLLDPRVINVPYLWRLLLVRGLIVPLRSANTQRAYQKVWGPEGSPLLVYSRRLEQKLAERLGDGYRVVLGFRYGQPSLAQAVQQLAGCAAIRVVPLYPQYAASSTASALAALYQLAAKPWDVPVLQVQPAFYGRSEYLSAVAGLIGGHASFGWDHLLFSYHGLPVDHMELSGCQTAGQACLDQECPTPRLDGKCYRSQCFATTRALAAALGLKAETYSTAFQSRLGRKIRIKPYTDQILGNLRHKGVKRLAVTCPSFAVDCLETLEEVGIRLRESWQKLGGEDFRFIPCLNDDPVWVQNLAQMMRTQPLI